MEEIDFGSDYQEGQEGIKIELKEKESVSIEYGDDTEESVGVKFEPISPQDRLLLAKRILLFSFICFISIAGLNMIFDNNESVEKVWSFTSVALNSIISLIIGFYFGKDS